MNFPRATALDVPRPEELQPGSTVTIRDLENAGIDNEKTYTFVRPGRQSSRGARDTDGERDVEEERYLPDLGLMPFPDGSWDDRYKPIDWSMKQERPLS